VLWLAFGRHIPALRIPVESGTSDRGTAYALRGPDVPPRVILMRYAPQNQTQAYRVFTIMSALHARRFPVPGVYYFGWSHHTRYVLLLLEHVEGRSVGEGQQHAFFARVGEDFARRLAELHQMHFQHLPDLPTTPFFYALRELTLMVRRLETPQLQEILDWLLIHRESMYEVPHTLVHGDYMLHNVLADRTRIVAVHGWENAVIADPRFDVGYTSAQLGSYDLALSDRFVAMYTEAAGPLPELGYWETFSALRLLARVAQTLSKLPAPKRDRFLAHVGPAWNGLLYFAESRTGLTLL
jgi:aminoglycoside phosphotransferase (APT) family kinase protein